MTQSLRRCPNPHESSYSYDVTDLTFNLAGRPTICWLGARVADFKRALALRACGEDGLALDQNGERSIGGHPSVTASRCKSFV